MTRLMSWLIMVPLAIAVVVFAIANRQSVVLDLWPLPIALDVPASSIGLVGGVIGFLTGAFVVWLSGVRQRAEYRKLVRQLEAAKREESLLKERLESTKPVPPPHFAALPVTSRADAA